MGFLTRVDGLSQISARTCGRRQRWCGSFPGQIRQGKRSRNSRTKAQADQATCAFLLVGGEAARRRPATGRAARSLGGLGWGICLRRHWLGIVASFREDDLFEGETCQKSGVFHHLGKRPMGRGKPLVNVDSLTRPYSSLRYQGRFTLVITRFVYLCCS